MYNEYLFLIFKNLIFYALFLVVISKIFQLEFCRLVVRSTNTKEFQLTWLFILYIPLSSVSVSFIHVSQVHQVTEYKIVVK